MKVEHSYFEYYEETDISHVGQHAGSDFLL